jgi:hypothetical protein
MALARFFTLEPQGARAEKNFLILKTIVDNWVVRKDDSTVVTININPQSLGKKKKENDFSMLDLILPISIAAETMEKEYANDINQFAVRFSLMCSKIKSYQTDNKGFYWKYYAPYFAQMSEKEFSGIFARIAFISTGDDSVIEWLNSNKELLDDFFRWSQGFRWSDK